jgi:hypothetical protein
VFDLRYWSACPLRGEIRGGEKYCEELREDGMKVLRREEIWIHTHFVTDCAYLPDHSAREIHQKMGRVLDKLGIVFGIHFDARGDEGLRIVLECIPFPETMAEIESSLEKIIEPVPARPRRTRVEIQSPTRRTRTKRR